METPNTPHKDNFLSRLFRKNKQAPKSGEFSRSSIFSTDISHSTSPTSVSFSEGWIDRDSDRKSSKRRIIEGFIKYCLDEIPKNDIKQGIISRPKLEYEKISDYFKGSKVLIVGPGDISEPQAFLETFPDISRLILVEPDVRLANRIRQEMLELPEEMRNKIHIDPSSAQSMNNIKEGSVDIVWSNFVFGRTPIVDQKETPAIWKEVARVIRPGGLLLGDIDLYTGAGGHAITSKFSTYAHDMGLNAYLKNK